MADKKKRSVSASNAKLPHAPQPQKQPVDPPNWALLADRYSLRLLFLLLLIALVLRISNLTAVCLWIDEMVHVGRAQKFVAGSGPLFTDDNNGILYTIILLPLFKIFGSGVFWARVPSVLFGLGMVYLLWRLGSLLFNRYVGLLAAFLGTFSLYLVFWSKMARNYAIFGFLFLLLGWVFLRAFGSEKTDATGNFWRRHGLSVPHIMALPVLFAAAFFAHHLSFFFLLTVTVYALCVAIVIAFRSEERFWSNKYGLMAILGFPLLLAVVMPPFGDLFRHAFSAVANERLAHWVTPDWERILSVTAAEMWVPFGVYDGVMRYDGALLYWPAMLGFAAAFWINWRSAFWLICSFGVPFILMSFIFREPVSPRYVIYIFPYFLIAAAVFFYALWQWVSTRLWTGMPNFWRYALLAFPFILGCSNARWPEILDLALARKTAGHIVNSCISNVNFTNWKDPGEYASKRYKPGDVVMATVPTVAAYYMDVDSVIWFRQNHYNTILKQFEPLGSRPGAAQSASSYDDLKRTVQNNARGWLLADYYMENVLVDDSCRHFVFKNMHYYGDASPDGTVMLFGWDKQKPAPDQQNLVVELGRCADKIIARDVFYTVAPEVLAKPSVTMRFRTRWVDSNREALVVINEQNAMYLAINRTNDPEMQSTTIPSDWFRAGKNRIQVMYDADQVKFDPRRGFTLYYLSFD